MKKNVKFYYILNIVIHTIRMCSGVMDVRVDFLVSGLRFKTWDLLLYLINISILFMRTGHKFGAKWVS